MATRTRRKLSLLATALVGAFLIVPVRGLFPDCGSGGGWPERTAPVASTRAFLDPFRVQLRVMVASQKAPLVDSLIKKDFKSPVGRYCIKIELGKEYSGDTAAKLARGEWRNDDPNRPIVWLPSSSLWLSVVHIWNKRAAEVVPTADEATSDVKVINKTPEVIAIPETLATKLGWWSKEEGWKGQEKPGWNDILAASKSGTLSLVKTNPHRSTSGLYSLLGAYFAANGSRIPQEKDLENLAQSVAEIEAKVHSYGGASLETLPQLPNDNLSPPVLFLQEVSVANYNRGNRAGQATCKDGADAPPVKLVALYPRDGTFVADQPFVILKWASREQNEAAEVLFNFLEDEGRKRFLACGFRDSTNQPGGILAHDNRFRTDITNEIGGAEGFPVDVVAAILRQFENLRKSGRVLILLDISEPASDSEAIQRSITDSVGRHLTGNDAVGVWRATSGAAAHAEIFPLPTKATDALGDDPWPPGDSETRLYDSLGEAVAQFTDTTHLNGIIVVTDKPGGRPDLRLLDRVGRARHDFGVQIFPIVLAERCNDSGSEDDSGLKEIAQRSGTTVHCVTDARKFSGAFDAAVTSVIPVRSHAGSREP